MPKRPADQNTEQADLFGEIVRTSLPATVRRVIEASAEIMDGPPDRLAFLHSVLCQVGMPRRKTEERMFERTSGGAVLRIEAGALFNGNKLIDQSLHYGAKPRLIMIHIGSEAVRTSKREIEIGNSTHEFMQTLGIDTNGRGYSMIKKQIFALAACRLTLGMAYGSRARTVNTQPIEQFDAWLHPTGQQLVMWPGSLVLSEPFFNTMLEYAVPLDRRALAALKHSALALDVYSWLAHRLYRINKSEGVKVSWANLREQFGQEYRCAKDFKKEFRQVLRQVLAVYPTARIEDAPGGILLRESPPPIEQATTSLTGTVSK